jgi:hypothetical protein
LILSLVFLSGRPWQEHSFAGSPVEFACSLLPLGWGMDALSETLQAAKLDSAFFYNGEFSAL